MDMKIEEVSLENAVHKLFDASSKLISLPSVYQDTEGHLTQISSTFPNPIVNLAFYMKTDPELSWVSNDR